MRRPIQFRSLVPKVDLRPSRHVLLFGSHLCSRLVLHLRAGVMVGFVPEFGPQAKCSSPPRGARRTSLTK